MKPESIERRLEQLVPSAFSERGMASIDEMLDELAGESKSAALVRRWWLAAGSLAAAVAMAAGLALAPRGGEAADPRVAADEELELVSDFETVVAAEEDEALVAGSDGSLHRAWRVRVMSEETFHDPDTGQDVRIVQPRDELVLVPVSSF